MVTSPAPARVLSASRTGVLDTPSTSARSVSTSGWPGLSSPDRIACLIASSTATVRDGRAPAPDRARKGVDIMYRVSYMTYESVGGRRPGCQRAAALLTPVIVGGQWSNSSHGDVHPGPARAILASGQHRVPGGLHARRVFGPGGPGARARVRRRGQLADRRPVRTTGWRRHGGGGDRQPDGTGRRPDRGDTPAAGADPLARRGRLGLPRRGRAGSGGRRGPAEVPWAAPDRLLVPVRGGGLDDNRAPHPRHPRRGDQGPDERAARRAGQLRRPGGARLPVPAAAGQPGHVSRAGPP